MYFRGRLELKRLGSMPHETAITNRKWRCPIRKNKKNKNDRKNSAKELAIPFLRNNPCKFSLVVDMTANCITDAFPRITILSSFINRLFLVFLPL